MKIILFYIKTLGFTLIEMTIVMFIVALLSAILFLEKGEGEKNLNLQKAIFQLSQDLRKVQGMTMSAQEVNCPNNTVVSKFGIHFKIEWKNYYVIFADCDHNYQRANTGKEDIRHVLLPKGIEIISLIPESDFSIVFIPPDPKVYINQKDWGEEAVIVLGFGSTKKRVKINSVGKIEIE